MSVDRSMDKEDVVCIYNGILLTHKKEWNNAVCSNMDGPGDYHTKSEKYKYMILLICGILKTMIQMNLFIKQKQTHRLRERIYGYGGKGGGRDR